MNANAPINWVSIPTPLNRKPGKTERRTWNAKTKHWERQYPQAQAVLAWLKGGDK
jgi:hypothetical protein